MEILRRPPRYTAGVKSGNAVLSAYGTTIFEAMSALAREHDAVNLGQGFPDDAGPEGVRQAAAEFVAIRLRRRGAQPRSGSPIRGAMWSW